MLMTKVYFLFLLLFLATPVFSQLEGTTWQLAPQAQALAVGPTKGDFSWWSNKDGDVSLRDCFFDDKYVFEADGTFKNVLDGETWNEEWQGMNPAGCGAPIAPHDGSVQATWSYDEAAGTITLTGKGAYLGLAKVHNNGELGSPAEAVASITYPVVIDGNTMTIDIDFGGIGYWHFVFKQAIEDNPEPEPDNASSCFKLIWADEFDGTSLDDSKWNYDLGNGCPDLCGWGNNEQQHYSNSTENVTVEDGVLKIIAKRDTLGGMLYSSGKIHTQSKGDFRYGRIEASMKLPETQGIWPAFWLLPTKNTYGEWPRSGEIDIMELLGHEPNKVHGTIHTGLPWNFIGESYTLPSSTFADSFHVFSIEWAPNTIRWYVDDILYHEVNSDILQPWVPFQEDFYLIFNIAVGGNWPGFPDATTVFPQTMEVDYVRVYNSVDRLQVFGEQPVMGATGIQYHTSDIADAKYSWTVPSGSTITAGQGTAAITVDWGCTMGDVLVELQTDCDTVSLTYPVDNFEAISVDGLETVAENQMGLTFSVPAVEEGVYTWTIPMDATIVAGQGTNEITVDWGCSAGEVVVNLGSACTTSYADTFLVALANYAISGFSIVQANSTNRVYSTANIAGATYNWSVPSDALLTAGQGTNEITVDFGVMNGDVSVEVTTSCGTQTYVLAINLDPSFIYSDFDGMELEWGDFGGATFEKIENPFPTGINTSDHVGQTRKDPGSQDWAGIFADLGGEMDLAANPFLHMKVYSETTGNVLFKLEDLSPGTISPIEIPVPYTTPNEWVNMVWDFTGQPTDAFDRIALFFDFGSTDTDLWYFDDIIGRSALTTNTEVLTVQPITISPNPTTGQLFIDLNGLFRQTSDFEVRIIDVQGKVVFSEQQQQNNEQFTLNLSLVPDGTYYIHLVGQEIHYVKPLVKIH